MKSYFRRFLLSTTVLHTRPEALPPPAEGNALLEHNIRVAMRAAINAFRVRMLNRLSRRYLEDVHSNLNRDAPHE